MNPYATHLPVLRAIGARLRIGAVLEFGCGLYSTLEFLNRQSFPHLFALESVEDDLGWKQRIQREVQDGRLMFSTGEALAARRLLLDHYDLIFIDNGRFAAERIPTIRLITAQRPKSLVVIHDYEVEAYRQAARGFEHECIYDALTPHTVLLWNGERSDLTNLW